MVPSNHKHHHSSVVDECSRGSCVCCCGCCSFFFVRVRMQRVSFALELRLQVCTSTARASRALGHNTTQHKKSTQQQHTHTGHRAITHTHTHTTMATRGVVQLRKLTLKYCEYGGSSRALREYISNGRLAAWASQHPDTLVEVKVKNGHHPLVKGEYLSGSVQHQVTVKNYKHWHHVEEVCQMMADRSGRKITKITTPVLTDTPSVQGVWTPFLNLQHEPDFHVTIHEVEQS